MRKTRTRAKFLSRSSEGKYWEQVGEVNEYIKVNVFSARFHTYNIRLIKQKDYANRECYPVQIPCYYLEKLED